MNTGWQFADVERIFRGHAKAKGVAYDPDRPLAALDKSAIKRASEVLGAMTWDEFADAASISRKTMEKWGNGSTRATVESAIFPALCDVAARPYREHREAYENSAWLPRYIEERVAYALTDATEPPEDAAAALNAAWDRYNVATLLLAAFTLSGDGLEHAATAARYVLAAQPYSATVRTQRPYSSNDVESIIAEFVRLMQEAEEMEREAVSRVPIMSPIGININQPRSDQLRAIVKEDMERLSGK